MTSRGTIALNKQIEWIPSVERRQHRQIQTNQPTPPKTRKEALLQWSVGEWATNKYDV
jgi:hypothetical protein